MTAHSAHKKRFSVARLFVLTVGFLAPGGFNVANAHDIGVASQNHTTSRSDLSVQLRTDIVLRSHDDFARIVLLAQAQPRSTKGVAASVPEAGGPAFVASSFTPFAGKLKTRFDDRYFYVEDDGLPAHNMMVGITAWQQQVPLPQPYTGNNAWRIPLHPVPSKNPVSIKGRFLRGAIALAANGIPIFNPQNNRGEVAQEIGELDQ